MIFVAMRACVEGIVCWCERVLNRILVAYTQPCSHSLSLSRTLMANPYTKSSSLSSSLLTHVGASHRGLLDAAPLAAGSAELRRLLHATQTLALSSFSMVHVVHDQLEAESGDSRATAVCSGSAEAVSDAVFLAAGGAGLLALPISRGLLPPFASMRSAVLRSSGLVVLAMTAKQRASTALWPGCSDIRDHWEGVRGRLHAV